MKNTKSVQLQDVVMCESWCGFVSVLHDTRQVFPDVVDIEQFA